MKIGQVDYRIVAEQNEYRPCEVLGIKALFHRYIEDVVLYIKTPALPYPRLQDENWQNCLRMIREDLTIPRGFDVDKMSKTVALVEYEDGTVQKVDPTNVKFLDTKEKMEGFSEEVCDAEEK